MSFLYRVLKQMCTFSQDRHVVLLITRTCDLYSCLFRYPDVIWYQAIYQKHTQVQSRYQILKSIHKISMINLLQRRFGR